VSAMFSQQPGDIVGRTSFVKKIDGIAETSTSRRVGREGTRQILRNRIRHSD
jgi:hypothetical protein